jgi:signal transduction histidine kinase
LDVATVVRFDPGPEFVLVGAAKSIEGLPVGSRWAPKDLYVSTRVLRTGHSARIDEKELLSARGPDAEALRRQGLMSQVGSPISVEGRLWGAVTVNAREELPPETEERLERFTELVATAIANAESRAELAASEARARKLAEEQASLRRVATLVANESSPDEIFAVVAEEVGQVLCVPIVVVVRYETDGSAMRVVGGWSERAFPVPMGTRLLLDGPSHFADVWATGRPARLDDPTDLPGEIAAAMRQAGVGSGAASPILVEGRIWGAIAVGSFGFSDRLPDDIEARLADFTELLATAIANSEAREGIRRLLDEQAALRRVATMVAKRATAEDVHLSVAQEVAHVFGVSLVTVCRYESGAAAAAVVLASLGAPQFPAGSSWPLDVPSLPATILETGRPARIDDYSTAVGLDAIARDGGVRASVGVPIVVDGSVWGSINVATPEEEPFPADAEGRLARFTELVATAIANSEARDNLRRLVDEQAALRRVATLVAEGAAPAALFSAVTEEVAGLFEPAAVTLNRYEGDVCTVLAATGIGFPVGSRWPLDVDSLAARVYEAGRPVHVADYTDIAGATPPEIWEDHPSESDLGVPIVVDGSLWGVFCVATPELDRNPSETAERIGRFTELVATAVSNATMRAEVAASRARVIAAGDESRRRIERDLHDGAQQQLVTLALELRSAEGRVPAGLEDMRKEFGRFAGRLTSVIEELREMSRGIHPAILTEGGLSPAIEALALRSPIPVELNVRCERRLPDGIEVAAYYVVSEALTNAAKHADASRVRIDLHVEEGTLCLSVVDDGVGGADPNGGSGLIGLKDRVEALGGTIDVASPPGSGTRLDVEIPLLGAHSGASSSKPLSRV